MARIKLAYIGGGSTRAPGTMASLIHQGHNFQGSEVVLIDIDESHLQLVKTLSDKMARNHGIDLTVSCTTDRRAGLSGLHPRTAQHQPRTARNAQPSDDRWRHGRRAE